MQCQACKQEILEGSRFCAHCGARIGGALPGVLPGAFESPRGYTPRHLADKILTLRSALEGERKQVTVLFADVSGFTSFSDKRDPEDVHRIMTRAFELMLAEVHRYEGTVNQFLGDGIMALFGAPIAHEDHVQRALHAALSIRDALETYRDDLRTAENVDFEVRQGLNTGTVVVGSIGSDLRMDYTAVGDTTNVAARLVQSADRGRIVISESLQRHAEGFFFLRPLGELLVKGKSEPIRAWELVATRQARTRLEVQAEHGLTPLVGREPELGLLSALFEHARSGRGQIAFISGDPGAGKSRLLLELRRRLGGEATWLEGHASSIGRGAAFHPMVDLLKRNFRIEDGDGEDAVGRKIERGVLLLGEDLRAAIPHFRVLLSLDPGSALAGIEPKQQRAQLFDALRQLIARAAAIHPQVFVIEDLHWMDQATEEFLLAAADTIPSSRVLCILTYRSAYAHRFGQQPHHSSISLGMLTPDQTEAMARAVLQADQLPEELRSLIIRVTEGNPFYVEEIVKTLEHSGAVRKGARALQVLGLQEVVVPSTIQSLIAARIDRLEESAKRALQTAAVVGRRFSLALLERTMDADERAQIGTCVEVLTRLEFIFQSRRSPDIEYTFKHALTQEVAYETLLLQRRRRLHGRVAAAVEQLARELPEEQYALLAYHYGRSAEQAKAIDYLMRAGDRAVRLYANAEAKLHYADALGRLQTQLPSPARDEQIIDLVIQICGVSDTGAEFSQDLQRLDQALALAQAAGDRRRESRVLYWQARTCYTTGRTTFGTGPAEQALAIADEMGDQALAALPVNLLGRLYFLSDFKKACPILERSMLLIDPANRVEIALAQGGLGWSLAMVGDFARALSAVDTGIAIARETGHLPTLAGCHMYRGCALAPRGSWTEATASMQEALALAQQVGDQFRIYLTTGFLGGYLVMQGQPDKGMELLNRMIAMAERIGTRLGLHNAYCYIAEAFLSQGRVAEAVASARKAIAMAVETQQRWTEGWARRVLGSALAHGAAAGDGDAERELGESVRILEDLGTLPDLARALAAHGLLLAQRGERQGSELAIGKAVSMFKTMGMDWDLIRLPAG